MVDAVSEPNSVLISKAEQLSDKDLADAYAVLGIQAQQLDISEKRAAIDPQRVPPWSDAEAFDKVLESERGVDDIVAFARAGFGRAQQLLDGISGELRAALCSQGAVRAEILALEADARELIKYLSTMLAGMIAVNAPAAVGGALLAIATTLAIIMIKNNLHKFCSTETIELAPA